MDGVKNSERKFKTGSKSPMTVRALLSRTSKAKHRIGSLGRLGSRGKKRPRKSGVKKAAKIGRIKARRGIESRAGSPRTSRIASGIKAQKADKLNNIFSNRRGTLPS
jgi:hypothetical protein